MTCVMLGVATARFKQGNYTSLFVCHCLLSISCLPTSALFWLLRIMVSVSLISLVDFWFSAGMKLLCECRDVIWDILTVRVYATNKHQQVTYITDPSCACWNWF